MGYAKTPIYSQVIGNKTFIINIATFNLLEHLFSLGSFTHLPRVHLRVFG